MPSAQPLVTIGCAVYNGEATLERALQTVSAQEYENLEVLISDDGSTDSSREIAADFAARDPRIKLLHNPKNIGVTANFNRLAREASGEYFMWADQDDIRDTSFVRKAVEALEADPSAVLCHSQTGVFMGDPDELRYLITLFGVDGVESRLRRYFMFLLYGSDTVLYGLMRTKVLNETRLNRADLGSANALLFELLLRGKFIEIPEVLYRYSSRGTKNRPSAREEYARVNPGKNMPRLYFPFLVLAMNQTRDIASLPADSCSWLEKLGLGSVLWGHTSAVAMTKLFYRGVARIIPNVSPKFTAFCDSIVEPKSHLIILKTNDEEQFPLGWAVKGGA